MEIKVTETNIDGCGSNAELFVHSSKELSEAALERLGELLHAVKRETNSDDWDTEEMVDEAISRFSSETGIDLKIVSAPYAAELEF